MSLAKSAAVMSFPATRPPRLLVVDDEQAIRFAVQDYFTRAGFEIDAAAGRGEAWGLLGGGGYGLLILDLCLTGGEEADGLELLREIRGAGLPLSVVVLTAAVSSELEARARHLGADAFFHKPTPLLELKDEAERLLAAAPA
jgi:DNA-binding response OmpR family regulator